MILDQIADFLLAVGALASGKQIRFEMWEQP